MAANHDQILGGSMANAAAERIALQLRRILPGAAVQEHRA
jgi:hypothetical protein